MLDFTHDQTHVCSLV